MWLQADALTGCPARKAHLTGADGGLLSLSQTRPRLLESLPDTRPP